MLLHGRRQEVHVIGHQDKGVHPATVASGGIAEIGEVALVVLLAMKTGLAVVAALNDVLGNTDEMKAGLSGHGHLPVATTGDQMNEAGFTVGILAETVF
jgi:hypothetical protein